MLGEWGLTHYFRPDWYHCDPTAYAAVLMNAYVRSQTALYSRLDDDIRNDVVRIANFVPVARRLIDMDGKREKSLAFVPVLSGPEIANAKARISQNFLVVAWMQALIDRAASYRFALERLIVAVPSPFAVDVERSLMLLRSRTAESVLVTSPQGCAVAVAPIPPRRAVVSK